MGASTVTGWATFGACHKMSYLYYFTNYNLYPGTAFVYSYKRMYGVVCVADLSVTGLATAALAVSTGYLPAKWGRTIPGFGAYSQNNGQLLSIRTNFEPIGQDLLISGALTLPPAGPLLVSIVGQFNIPLQSSLDGNTQITIVGSPGSTNIPYLSSALGTCGIFYTNKRMPIGCVHTSIPTQLQYTLTINEDGLLPAGGTLQIVHYGLSTNSSYNTVTVDVTVSSLLNNPAPLANDLIFKKTGQSFAWSGANYVGPSSIMVNSFKQWTSNKATYEDF